MSLKDWMNKFAKEESDVKKFLKKTDEIGKKVIFLEEEFAKFSKKASSRVYNTLEKRTAVLEEFQIKKRNLVNALKKLRAQTINLEIHSINTINRTSKSFLDLVRREVPEVLKSVAAEEIAIQEEIIGFTEEEERIWSEIKSEASANIKKISSPKIKKVA